MPGRPRRLDLTLDELEEQAKEVLDRGAYDFVAGGADDEVTLADNRAAWGRLRLRPRVLRDVSHVDTATTVMGRPLSTPVMVAPVAFQRLLHEEAELGTARGAAAAGAVLVLSTRSSTPIEQVAATGVEWWFQLYVLRDRGWTAELVDRAVAAGCRSLVVTVDTPVLGFRRRDAANAFQVPAAAGMANVSAAVGVSAADVAASVGAMQSPAVGPADIEWLAGRGLPVVAKGVLRADAARACVDAGASAVIVSNHGGRQLDGAVPTAYALPEVVDAVEGSAEVLVDGGVRRGTDVLKALALGARAVLVGRPVAWGLATGGGAGVRGVLEHLSVELALAMALAGAARVDDLGPDLVVVPPGLW
ncbi:MAG TPA: alpha-hydroxy acid oxidase [Acidimicrobiales bacterium]|nr:alpha-hydroxy acid oxidase [Acidimicrobiales bacterium]